VTTWSAPRPSALATLSALASAPPPDMSTPATCLAPCAGGSSRTPRCTAASSHAADRKVEIASANSPISSRLNASGDIVARMRSRASGVIAGFIACVDTRYTTQCLLPWPQKRLKSSYRTPLCM